MQDRRAKRITRMYPTIPASDVERAVAFYESVLGLQRDHDFAGTILRSGDSMVSIYRSDHAGTAEHTVMAMSVSDLEAAMALLRERGVEFLEYDYPDFRTVDGIALLGSVRTAWFADPDGNIIAVSEHLG